MVAVADGHPRAPLLGVDEIDMEITPGHRNRDLGHPGKVVSAPDEGRDQQHVAHPETEPEEKDGPVQDPDQRVQDVGKGRT